MQEYIRISEEESKKLKCPICGSKMYITDQCMFSVFRCKDAKFWDHHRGSEEQISLHKHFYDSTIYVKVIQDNQTKVTNNVVSHH